MAQRKRICHCATKTGRGIVFPGHYPQVTVDQTGITVDTVNCKRQRIPLMEDQTKAKRQSDGSRVEARVKWTGTDLMEQCQSLLRCWYLFTLNGTWDASKWFLLDQQLTKPTSYLLTQPGVSLCLLLALRMGVSRSHGDFYRGFLDSSQAASRKKSLKKSSISALMLLCGYTVGVVVLRSECQANLLSSFATVSWGGHWGSDYGGHFQWTDVSD